MSIPVRAIESSVSFCKKVSNICLNFSSSLSFIDLWGTLRNTETKFALIGIIGDAVGSGSVGEYVGDIDEVGSADGLRVGDCGGIVIPGTGAAVMGAGVVGEKVGSSVTGDLVGIGRVGL